MKMMAFAIAGGMCLMFIYVLKGLTDIMAIVGLLMTFY